MNRFEPLRTYSPSGRRADLGELLDRDEHHQRTGSGSAVLLVERQPEQLVLPEELDHVPRELGLLVDFRGARRDPVPRERSYELPNLALLVAQRVVGHARSLRRAVI
jgi:hypothetical protein